MHLALLIITIVVSVVIVRIGAVALELTGIGKSVAFFQALSCFTGTGFTTKESELITIHPLRRRIVTVLMVLGNIGIVTMIATFANSLNTDSLVCRIFTPSIFPDMPSFLMIFLDLGILGIVLYVIYKSFTNSGVSDKLSESIRKNLIRRAVFKKMLVEDLLVTPGGFGVSQIMVAKDGPLKDKTIEEVKQLFPGLLVLLLERDERATPYPPVDIKIISGDRLVCFGKLADMKKHFGNSGA